MSSHTTPARESTVARALARDRVGIPFAFIAVAVVLALFCPGYMAMSRRIRNASAFYKAHMFARTCVR